MNHRKRLKRARKQGAKDWAERVAPVYLEQIAEVCRERDAAKERAAKAESDVRLLQKSLDEAGPFSFARQQLEFRASSLESDVAAAVRDAGIYRDRMEQTMDERDKLKARLWADVDGPQSRLSAWQNRTKIAETRVAEMESLQYGGWPEKAQESAREAADANGKLIAVTAERDTLRDNLAMLVARHDEVMAERDAGRAKMDRQRLDWLESLRTGSTVSSSTLSRRNVTFAFCAKFTGEPETVRQTIDAAMRAAGVILPEEKAP